MPRSVSALPNDLTRLIFSAGDRRIVLVEGVDDKAAFDYWYADRLSDIEFFASGGSVEVRVLLPLALARSQKKRIFGITDRDWQTDTEVQAWKMKPDPHLFILKRYDLENYLLDPKALQREIAILYNAPDASVATSEAIEARLLEICQRLCPILAANWIFFDLGYAGGIDYFDDAWFPHDGAVLVRATAAKLGCSEGDADTQIAAKEADIVPRLTSSETAFVRCKGKTVFFHFHQQHVRRRLPALESFRNVMVRAVAVPQDIREIVEDHILVYP